MASSDFLPSLSQFDIEHAAQLIQQAYSPSGPVVPEELKRLQQDLFELQKRPEAWGLVVPLLNHQDQNVQFYGAHTAQVKIARDWAMFPNEHIEALRDLIVQLTAHSIAIGRSKFILRKLFVAINSLAIRLVPGRHSQWPDWIMSCITAFSNQGASVEYLHDFLAITAEEMGNADLLKPQRDDILRVMSEAVPMIVQAITNTITQPLGSIPTQHYLSALRCLQAWLGHINANHLTPLIPILIQLLDPKFPEIFIGASDALQEITTKSPLSDGSGSKTLTEPLMIWMDTVGRQIMEAILADEDILPVSHSLCKLVVALGDHSTSYIATNIASSSPVSTGPTTPPTTKGQLTQSFLSLLLAFTALPGHYGVDEEESELTLGFWYLFQEALWSTDYYFEDGDDDRSPAPADTDVAESKQVLMAKAVFSEVVKVLRRKVAFPPSGSGWSRDEVEKFQVYRRDVGDTLINAYYVLREDMLGYYVNDVAERLAARKEGDGWQEIEATLHCIMSIQEAVDMETVPHLDRLFSPDIFGRLPSTGRSRVRRTALGVIGSYSSWFATSGATSAQPNLLLTVLSYVVSALPDPTLSLPAATALRNLCEANRKELALHIAAFGELHANIGNIPDSEKSKVLQSIASVIQAIPPLESIPSIEAIVAPSVQRIFDALQIAPTNPEEAQLSITLHLETLAGIAKGLTRSSDGLVLEDDSDPDVQAQIESIKQAREDPRTIKIRESIFAAIRAVVELWSAHSDISHGLSELCKSITALPADTTVISLPAGPLLELVCLAAQRQLTAAWLSLAHILIAQLNPPIYSVILKNGPSTEAEMIIQRLLPILLETALTRLGAEGAMESNPDIVQGFFSCMEKTAAEFTSAFYALPRGLFDALIQCAIKALTLQERYSLVSACNFLSTLIHRSSLTDELIANKTAFMAVHGRAIMQAILEGFAGVAPRSAVPNLIEMLGTLLSRANGPEGGVGGGAPQWMKEILLSEHFVPSKAGPDAKTKFMKAVSGSRSLKRTREAAQQFTLIARGLEGSNFGYTTLTM
ncbi:Importin-13 [Psilocybe cubensis]|uniref:Importin-13 n=2 Tax=Psilocybe cubensis TaxID=181762 RepID=A0A8H7XPJ6_PSICU|nr:Importin-13 [Psilocybe cubensis]KAH9477137.1 Importin-13 [Psilocybe cubensis]